MQEPTDSNEQFLYWANKRTTDFKIIYANRFGTTSIKFFINDINYDFQSD